MKKTTILITALLLAALIAGTGFAWGPGMGKGMGPGYSQDRWGQTSWNDLSDEQKDQLAMLRQKFIDDTYALRSEKRLKRHEIRLLMETSEPDRAKLNQLSQDIADLEKKYRDRQIDFRLEAKKIAPEFNMRSGSRQGRGRWQGYRGGQNGQWNCQGPGSGGCYNNYNSN